MTDATGRTRLLADYSVARLAWERSMRDPRAGTNSLEIVRAADALAAALASEAPTPDDEERQDLAGWITKLGDGLKMLVSAPDYPNFARIAEILLEPVNCGGADRFSLDDPDWQEPARLLRDCVIGWKLGNDIVGPMQRADAWLNTRLTLGGDGHEAASTGRKEPT